MTTLNLSKSVRASLLSCLACLLAFSVAAHFSFSLNSSTSFLSQQKILQDSLSLVSEDLSDEELGDFESLDRDDGPLDASGGSFDENLNKRIPTAVSLRMSKTTATLPA